MAGIASGHETSKEESLVNMYGEFSSIIFGVQIGCAVVLILAVYNLIKIAIKNKKEKQ